MVFLKGTQEGAGVCMEDMSVKVMIDR